MKESTRAAAAFMLTVLYTVWMLHHHSSVQSNLIHSINITLLINIWKIYRRRLDVILMQIIFCVFLPTPTSLHMLDIWAERVQPILGSCLHYVSVPEIKQCIWGWSPLRTRLYQMQFSLYIRAHVFDMLMKVESCSESWLLHLDVTSLNSGGKKSAYITSIFCRPAAIQYIQHSQCGSITTAQKKLGKKRKEKAQVSGCEPCSCLLEERRKETHHQLKKAGDHTDSH